jgi:FkbM family methyltransferase
MKKYFLDCGSNLGQGYEYFRQKYGDAYFYMLFEPNINCYNKLIEKYTCNNTKIFNNAIYIDESTKQFNFVTEYCVGGSIIENHNSAILNKTQSTNVKCIDICTVINSLLLEDCEIIIKFDIESSEYDVLEKLIETKLIHKIKKIYCEFHTQYMNEKDRQIFVPREQKILKYISDNNISLELWR